VSRASLAGRDEGDVKEKSSNMSLADLVIGDLRGIYWPEKPCLGAPRVEGDFRDLAG